MISGRNLGAQGSQTVARLFRNLREWLTETYDAQVADRVIPDFTTNDRARSSRKFGPPKVAPAAYGSSDQEGMMVFEVDGGRGVTSNNSGKGEFDAHSMVFAEEQQVGPSAELVAAIDELVAQHRIMAYERSAFIAFAQSIDADQVMEFGEGNTRKQRNAGAWFLEFLKRLPFRPESRLQSLPYDAPMGYTVDRQQLALHRQALAFAEQYQTDYLTAVMELS